MRLLCFAVGLVAWLSATTAFADTGTRDTSYYVSLSVGEDYGFPDNEWIPVFQEESTEGSLTFGVVHQQDRNRFTLTASHIVTDDDEGVAVGVQFRRERCFLTVNCSLGVRWRDVGTDTVTYEAGLSVPIEEGLDWVDTAFAVDGSARTGDGSESAAAANLKFTLPVDGPDRWAINANAGLGYGFETDDTEPTWGLGASYTHRIDAQRSLEVGAEYKTEVSLDENDELEWGRRATVRIRFNF